MPAVKAHIKEKICQDFYQQIILLLSILSKIEQTEIQLNHFKFFLKAQRYCLWGSKYHSYDSIANRELKLDQCKCKPHYFEMEVQESMSYYQIYVWFAVPSVIVQKQTNFISVLLNFCTCKCTAKIFDGVQEYCFCKNYQKIHLTLTAQLNVNNAIILADLVRYQRSRLPYFYGNENRYQVGNNCVCKNGYFDTCLNSSLTAVLQAKIIPLEYQFLVQINAIIFKGIVIKGKMKFVKNSIIHALDATIFQLNVRFVLLNQIEVIMKNLSHVIATQDIIILVLKIAKNVAIPVKTAVQEIQKYSIEPSIIILVSVYSDNGQSVECEKCDIQCLSCIDQYYQYQSCPQTRKIQNNCKCAGYYDVSQQRCLKCNDNQLIIVLLVDNYNI